MEAGLATAPADAADRLQTALGDAYFAAGDPAGAERAWGRVAAGLS